MSYNTKQKELIKNLISRQKHEFTIKDIYEKLKDNTGLTTIYRVVDQMINDGYLEKIIKDNNTTYYQYLEKCNEENHFYLRCEKCGNMIHVDCDCISELITHITVEHKFIPNREHIIINGICNKCSGGKVC